MCKPYFRPSKKVLERCFDRNPHGAGLAYPEKGKLVLKKGYFDFEDFYEEFVKVSSRYPLMVHFRWASAGEINKENCHPFVINKDCAMVHNGTIWDFVPDPKKTKKSDTRLYVERVLSPMLPKNNPKSCPVTKYLLEKSIGRSKIIILDKFGRYCILNEGLGVWSKGIWYSNDGFKEFSEYAGTTLPRQLEFDIAQ